MEGYIDWDREHLMHGTFPLGRNAGLIIDDCDGIYFQDTEAKKNLDGSSQLICVNLGYGYKKEVADAVYQQMLKLPAGVNFFGLSHQASIACGKKLAELTPVGLDRFYFIA